MVKKVIMEIMVIKGVQEIKHTFIIKDIIIVGIIQVEIGFTHNIIIEIEDYCSFVITTIIIIIIKQHIS